MELKFFIVGIIFWLTIIFFIYALRPSSSLHKEISSINLRKKIICSVTMAILIGACVIPMAWNPHWTGEIYDHHNQYQLLADAFLKGQLYLDETVHPKLAELENPYDPQQNSTLNLDSYYYPYDHAFYKNHYYVYFGVVPVLTTFLPYKLITGQPLAAYHSTQIFVALFIIGMFALLYLTARKFFARMSFGVYLSTAFCLSLVSVLYCTEAPALYCAASSSRLCMEIWSVYFFARAAWNNDSSQKFFAEIFIGASLGALAFGCKPTIALANVLILPLIPKILNKGDSRKILPLIFFPYFVTGTALMAYNYLRFENVFEFGASYQLTGFDQHNYGKFFERFNPERFIKESLQNFFGIDFNLPSNDNKPPGALRHIIFWLPFFFAQR